METFPFKNFAAAGRIFLTRRMSPQQAGGVWVWVFRPNHHAVMSATLW